VAPYFRQRRPYVVGWQFYVNSRTRHRPSFHLLGGAAFHESQEQPACQYGPMTMGLAQNSEQVVTPNSRAYRIRKCRQSLTAHSRVGNPCWCGSPSIMARLARWVYRDAGQRLQHDPSRKVSGFKYSGTSQRRVDWPTGLTQTTRVALGQPLATVASCIAPRLQLVHDSSARCTMRCRCPQQLPQVSILPTRHPDLRETIFQQQAQDQVRILAVRLLLAYSFVPDLAAFPIHTSNRNSASTRSNQRARPPQIL